MHSYPSIVFYCPSQKNRFACSLEFGSHLNYTAFKPKQPKSESFLVVIYISAGVMAYSCSPNRNLASFQDAYNASLCS